MAKGVTDQRTCAKCQQSRPVAAFYARTRGGYQSVCRECYSLYRRGLLCGQCNRMLGCAKDSVDVLRAAIDYLGGV